MSTSLSLYIHCVDFDSQLLKNSPYYNSKNQIWCVFSIDGSEPVSTSAAQMSFHTDFNYEIDMKINSLANAYLYATICCFSDVVGEDIVPLARAKVLLQKVPLNSPNAFRIPLMSKKTKQTFHFKNRQKTQFLQFATILISGIFDSNIINNDPGSSSVFEKKQSERNDKAFNFRDDDSSTFA